MAGRGGIVKEKEGRCHTCGALKEDPSMKNCARHTERNRLYARTKSILSGKRVCPSMWKENRHKLPGKVDWYKTDGQIAQEYGLNQPSVWRLRKRLGLPRAHLLRKAKQVLDQLQELVIQRNKH